MIGNFINIILKKIGDKRSTLEGELSLNGYLIISNYYLYVIIAENSDSLTLTLSL